MMTNETHCPYCGSPRVENEDYDFACGSYDHGDGRSVLCQVTEERNLLKEDVNMLRSNLEYSKERIELLEEELASLKFNVFLSNLTPNDDDYSNRR